MDEDANVSNAMLSNKMVEETADNRSVTTDLSTELAETWANICSGLRRDLGAQIFGQWIKPIKLAQFDEAIGELQLVVPSEFAASWIRDRYADRLTLA